MTQSGLNKGLSGHLTRRQLLAGAVAGGAIAAGAGIVSNYLATREQRAEVFIARAASYEQDLAPVIEAGLRQLGVEAGEIRGRKILLKPNLVESLRGSSHVCTRPEVVLAAAQAFLRMGAAGVIVAEGPGHCRDTVRVLDETGMLDMLVQEKLRFVDLNNDDLIVRPSKSRLSGLKTFTLPAVLEQADWIVSMPKMKTHHWAGVTLSMKNLFGLLPGIVYGWPKNVLHLAGIEECILDINATVRPHFAIVDGIVGMEGDGPIMGTPKSAGVIVMGRDLPAVDATATRVMGFDPRKVAYLRAARGRLGTISPDLIDQRGETIDTVRTRFDLLDQVPALRRLREA